MAIGRYYKYKCNY